MTLLFRLCISVNMGSWTLTLCLHDFYVRDIPITMGAGWNLYCSFKEIPPITLWNRVLKELCKYHANISLDQGLKVLVPPPQNLWLLGNQLYVCWNNLDQSGMKFSLWGYFWSIIWIILTEFDNVKYARGHNQYICTPYQLNQGREFIHTSCKALTSVKAIPLSGSIEIGWFSLFLGTKRQDI